MRAPLETNQLAAKIGTGLLFYAPSVDASRIVALCLVARECSKRLFASKILSWTGVPLNYGAEAELSAWSAFLWNCFFCWSTVRTGARRTREEILQRIWGKDVFVDADNSINTAIRKIRGCTEG